MTRFQGWIKKSSLKTEVLKTGQRIEALRELALLLKSETAPLSRRVILSEAVAQIADLERALAQRSAS